jgi:hypothetical protein
MRTLLLPALFAFGVVVAGNASASPTIGAAINDEVARNGSPSVRQVAFECRTFMKCDKNNRHCVPTQVCRN